MKTILFKGLVICALIASSLVVNAQGNYYFTGNTLTDPYGGFQVTFAAKPSYDYNDVESAVGVLRMYTFMHETYTTAFMVSYVDYPAELVAKADKDAMLKGALEGFVSNVQLVKRSEQKINYEKHQGLMFYADNGEYYACLRDYLVNNRLYQVGILKKGEISAQEENEFFDSFVLTK